MAREYRPGRGNREERRNNPREEEYEFAPINESFQPTQPRKGRGLAYSLIGIGIAALITAALTYSGTVESNNPDLWGVGFGLSGLVTLIAGLKRC